MQAHFLCMAHNLMVRCDELARLNGLPNAAELTRRAQRLEQQAERLAEKNETLPLLVRALQRLTVRSVEFIRWLFWLQLFAQPHHPPALAALRQL